MALCLFVFVLGVFGESFAQSQLKLVTVLYRHGDRSPVRAYPTDPYQEDAWPQGFGQLTQEGMRQHFQLGQFLRKRYSGFLSEPYTRYEIAVRSTDYDRTLMSAEANLAGLYPPNGSQIFHRGLDWQPIPIHTVPQDQEKLLSFPLPNCPRYSLLMNETEKTDFFLNMTRTYGEFLAMVRNKTGEESTSIDSIWSIHDTLFCEEKHGMTPPDWVTPEVMNTLQILKNFGFQIMFGTYKREEKSRLQGGLLLDQIIKNISAAATLVSGGQLKLIMYSAHDTTIVALQEALHVFNGLQPPYASCHIFELHQYNNSFAVEMFYHNDSNVAEPYRLTLPGCTQSCPLQDFIRLTHSVIPTDWDKECEVNSPSNETGTISLQAQHGARAVGPPNSASPGEADGAPAGEDEARGRPRCLLRGRWHASSSVATAPRDAHLHSSPELGASAWAWEAEVVSPSTAASLHLY
ncbi:lysosomal acid phosphatase-like isoform X2 [Hoplias malabaricus]|uniref:lysosomal acid phosphatase-like isoform X2 n=1 Tax=Hoplias malabaricus TaxID=27720 RepID=UPI0034626831